MPRDKCMHSTRPRSWEQSNPGFLTLISCMCGPAFFTCIPTQWRDSLFISEKLSLEKVLESPLIFYFYFLKENKIKKKTLSVTPRKEK